MEHNTQALLAVAKGMAWESRSMSEPSKDKDDFWEFIELGRQQGWLRYADAALTALHEFTKEPLSIGSAAWIEAQQQANNTGRALLMRMNDEKQVTPPQKIYSWEGRILKKLEKMPRILGPGFEFMGFAVVNLVSNEAALIENPIRKGTGPSNVCESDLRQDVMGDATHYYRQSLGWILGKAEPKR